MADGMVRVDVDEATAADERRERAEVVAREIARAAARAAIATAVREKSGEAGGHLVALGAALLARADVRSWHLLPRELVVVRLRLPAGPHVLTLDPAHGANMSGAGLVTVVAGRVTIVPARIWREGSGSGRSQCPPPRSCAW